MQMTGETFIAESRETVWNALNDPQILRECIPGCQSLEKLSETEMTALAVLKVGPVSAKFSGKVLLSEMNAPVSYRISGEGQGGVAGFAKGSALVRLDEAPGGTRLSYEVDAQVGGKLANLGGRLIEVTARKMAEAFFEKFAQEIRARAGQDAPAVGTTAPDMVSAAPAKPQTEPPVQRTETIGRDTAPVAPKIAAYAAAVVFALLWLTGLRADATGTGLSGATLAPEFYAALQLLLVGALGYLFGRQAGARR